MRLLLVSALLVSAFVSCAPCLASDGKASSVCTRLDAGVVGPDAPFTLFAETFATSASCSVRVDGGLIELDLSGTSCGGANAGRPVPATVPCAFPALPAGSYDLATTAPVTMTLGDGGVVGIPDCTR